MLGIKSTKSPPIILATVLTYWAFRCRDKLASPANGLKTWEYLQSSVKNSAIGATGLDDYLQALCHKLIVKSLSPKELAKIVMPQRQIIRANLLSGEVEEMFDDSVKLSLLCTGWPELLDFFAPQGLRESDVLRACKESPAIVTTHVRVRFEEDRTLTLEEIEEIIDVESFAE